MTRKRPLVTVAAEEIERQIYLIRGERVMLDSDLAALYGVPTKRLNEQVRRKRGRFPPDFAFQLTQQEFTNLRSQLATSGSGYGGRRYRPWVFTEPGVAMLSSVLNSRLAVQVNVEMIRVFIRLRRLLATPGELVTQLTRLAETVQLHDDQIKVISEVLRQLTAPPPPADRGRRIGFQSPERPADDPHPTTEDE